MGGRGYSASATDVAAVAITAAHTGRVPSNATGAVAQTASSSAAGSSASATIPPRTISTIAVNPSTAAAAAGSSGRSVTRPTNRATASADRADGCPCMPSFSLHNRSVASPGARPPYG
jgi:hypothetical protein